MTGSVAEWEVDALAAFAAQGGAKFSRIWLHGGATPVAANADRLGQRHAGGVA